MKEKGKYEVKIHITQNQNQSTRVSTSSNIAGRAFSKVEYANDTPVRLGKGVLDVSESKAREEGPEDPVSTILDIVVFCKALGYSIMQFKQKTKFKGFSPAVIH